MTFASVQQQNDFPQQQQPRYNQQLSLCMFRHKLGQRLIAGTLRIDDAIEEVQAYAAANKSVCVNELVQHLRETVRWLSHPTLVRNRVERERAITLITRRANRRVYCAADLPR